MMAKKKLMEETDITYLLKRIRKFNLMVSFALDKEQHKMIRYFRDNTLILRKRELTSIEQQKLKRTYSAVVIDKIFTEDVLRPMIDRLVHSEKKKDKKILR